jgi:SpoVK/Ycf46/Vps4 family AAA+-type ATPase
VDSLLGRRSGQGMPSGGGGGEADRRVTNEFLSWMDGIRSDSSQDARVVVMAATNHPWDLDEAALSR